MKIRFHGGLCCGIKHIEGFGNNPEAKIEPLDNPKPYEGREAFPDEYGEDFNTEKNMFYGEAPEETHLQRLDRYLVYLAERREYGIVEVCLTDYACYAYSPSVQEMYNQIPPWESLLLERGFVLVTKCYNSNSNNNVYVYHKAMDREI